ncbi:MAG: hypothetical protein ING75_03855 [Rhodocyclaceae bacterium]|nr:hypothetical protein [Rhodocyclaceae bacterium]
MNYFTPGIAYLEKSQLDYLAAKVAEAQYQVSQQQATVNALETKSTAFNAFLASADSDKQTALANLNQAHDIHSGLKGLTASTASAQTQCDKAYSKTFETADEMANLVNKLIFAVEIFEKFGDMVNKHKVNNVFIPDSLISQISKGTTDANNAIALTLTALQSCYAAEATALRSKRVIQLQVDQLSELVARFEAESDSTISAAESATDNTPLLDGPGLLSLSKAADTFFGERYREALVANTTVNKQLAYAQQMLGKATTSLNSWQSGLAAATAAAFAA